MAVHKYDLPRPPSKISWLEAPMAKRRAWIKQLFIAYPELSSIINDTLENVDYCNDTGLSRGMHIVAESGAGKSTLVDQIDRIVTCMYWREDPEKTIKPVLRLEAPSPCTPKELCRHTLESLGDTRARTRQSKDPMRSLARLTADMMNACEVRIVLFDNFQDIPSARRARGIEQLGIQLRELMDMTHCTWMYLGTEESRSVVSAKSQLIKRVPYVKTVDYFDIAKGKKRYLRLLEHYDEWLPLAQSSCKLLLDLSGPIYIATEGVLDRITRLLDGACFAAVSNSREYLIQSDLEAAFSKTFGPDHANPFVDGFVPRALDRANEPYAQFGARRGRSAETSNSGARR